MKTIERIFLVGRILSPLYGFAMRIRSFLYRHHIVSTTKLSVPVISVGNLTMGGTGKTPMVIYLARLFVGKIKPVVISRGYGGRSKDPVNIVSDGKQVILSAMDAGDEPRLLADCLAGVPILTGAKRVATGSYAVKEMAADLIIMDDGFQHMALCRDLDLVLFSAASLLGNGWVFPGGQLREPFSALSRAHAFVFTGVNEDNIDSVDTFAGVLLKEYPQIPVFQGKYKVAGVHEAGSKKHLISHEVNGKSLYAFCGIATPKSFFNSLVAEKMEVLGHKTFSDHHTFSVADLRTIEREALAAGCQALITTAKDFVKLADFEMQMPLWILNVELVMDPYFDAFVMGQTSLKDF